MSGGVIFLFVFAFGPFCSGQMNSCTDFEIQTEYLNKYLVGHDISESNGVDHKECVQECFALTACKSIDYNRSNKTCKLNDVDSFSVDFSEYIHQPGAIFSDITQWPSVLVGSCSSRPCTEHQRCIPDKNTFHCVEIVCEQSPSVKNGKLILAAPDKHKFRDTATVQCNPLYVANQPSVKCLHSELWEQASCLQDSTKFTDCKELLQKRPDSETGVYDISLWQSKQELKVYCDMDIDGGGWTVFQKRFNGLTDFYLGIDTYRSGFGNLHDEFWLGLNIIQEIAEQSETELRLDVSRNNGAKGFETFQNFRLDGPEYTLKLGTQSGILGVVATRGISLNNGFNFTTYDHDVDDNASTNCAIDRHGAWWHEDCTMVNLNGRYCTPGTQCSPPRRGFTHYGFVDKISLKTSLMMIRRIN